MQWDLGWERSHRHSPYDFATSITRCRFSTTVVPIEYRRYFLLNPLSGALNGFRWSVLGTSPPGVTGTLIALAGAIVSVLIGAAIFARYERQLADVI